MNMFHPSTIAAIVSGKSVQTSGQSAFMVQNPKNLRFWGLGEGVHSTCSNTRPSTIQTAVAMAHEGWFTQEKLKSEMILAFLRTLKSELEKIKEPWIKAIHLSTGLPLSPRLDKVEWDGMMLQLDQAIELAESNSWRQPDLRKDNDFQMALWNDGLGVAACKGPNNFALRFSSVVGTHALMNWVVGNPVMAQPHPALTVAEWYPAQAVINAMKHTRMPDWMFAFLPGEDPSVPMALLGNEMVSGIYFTGSSRVGNLITAQANRREYKPRLLMETGAPNIWFVCESSLVTDDDVRTVAKKIYDSTTMAAGAFCTKADIIVIERCKRSDALLGELVRLFLEAPAQLCLSSRMAIEYSTQMAKLREVTEIESLAKSQAVLDSNMAHASAELLSVTAKVLLDDVNARSECFGPSTRVIVVDDITNSLTYLPRQNLAVAIEASDEQLRGRPIFLAGAMRITNRIALRKAPTGLVPCRQMSHGLQTGFGTSSGPRAVFGCLHDVCFDGWQKDLLPVGLY